MARRKGVAFKTLVCSPIKALMRALVMSKADFVQLSAQFQFDFDRFLTVERLYELYDKTIHKARVKNICTELKEGCSVQKNYPLIRINYPGGKYFPIILV